MVARTTTTWTSASLKVGSGSNYLDEYEEQGYGYLPNLQGRHLFPIRVDSAGSETYGDLLTKNALKLYDMGKIGLSNGILFSAIGANLASAAFIEGLEYRIDKSPTQAISITGDELLAMSDWFNYEPAYVDPLKDQPRYSYNEVIQYAEKLGLNTDFPV